MGFPSGIDCGIWVGELLLGVEPRNRRLVENFLDKLLPPFSAGSCDCNGDITSS